MRKSILSDPSYNGWEIATFITFLTNVEVRLIHPLNKLDNPCFHRYLLSFQYSASTVTKLKELKAVLNVVLKANRYFRELNSILHMLQTRAEELT